MLLNSLINHFSTNLADLEDMCFFFETYKSYLISSFSHDFSLYCLKLLSSNKIQDFCSADNDQFYPRWLKIYLDLLFIWGLKKVFQALFSLLIDQRLYSTVLSSFYLSLCSLLTQSLISLCYTLGDPSQVQLGLFE